MKRNLLVCSVVAVAGGAVVAQLTQGDASDTPVAAEQLYPQEWLDELEAIAKRNPDDITSRLRLGGMLKEMGRGREAQRWISEAANIDADVVDDTLFPRYRGEELPQAISGTEYPVEGPDVLVGRLYDLRYWGRSNEISAFSFGTESCNAGDTNLNWIQNTNEHPVIAQHMYRLIDGRFEMIGQSWLKHGFFALSLSLCQDQFGYSCQSSPSNVLGVGCSDPYSGDLNGSYTWLGPKHEVNASTGYFPYPYGSYPNNEPIGKRLQVHDDYLKPSLNQGALYFIEGHYIAADDAAAGNDLNNASYRRVNVTEPQTNVFNLHFVANHDTRRELPAIYAWQEFDPTVEINTVDVIDDGRFLLGFKVTDNGDGTWNYEYALHNFNSDRSAGSFSVEVADSVNVTDVGFHNVQWHSGAPYDESDWNVTHENGVLTWSTESYDNNPNANALRWGTLYNFRFVADAPPFFDDATIGLFKPGTGPDAPASVAIAGVSPETPPVVGDLNGDGVVDVSDLLILLAAWGECPERSCPADLNGDGSVDVSDLLILLGNWG